MPEKSHYFFAKMVKKTAFAMVSEPKYLCTSSFFLQEHLYAINYQMQSHKMCLPIVAIAQVVKTTSKELQTCIVMHHDLFDDGSQIYAVAQYCKGIQEGAVGNLFQIDEHADLAVAEEAAQGNDCVMQLPSLTRTTVEDISHFRAQGFEVDDDNDPAPENVPAASTPSTTSCIYLD